MPTYAQAGRYGPATIAGAPANALLRVLDAAGSDALLYTDISKNKTAPPYIRPDEAGNVTFFADPGTYTVRWSSGSTSVTIAGGTGAVRPVGNPRDGLGNRFAFIGDSTTIGATDSTRTGSAWPTYASLLSNGRIRLIINAGQGGNKTDQMLVRFDADVAPYEPSAVAILAGTNDISLSYAWTTTRDNIIALVAKTLAIGAAPILCTILPNGTGSPGDRLTKAHQINTWLRSFAAANEYPLVDFHRATVDGSTGGFAAGMTADNLHPSAAGCIVMAQAFNAAVLPLVPPGESLVADTTFNNLLPNPLFLTDTSGVPTGWTAFGAGANMVNSIVVDSAIVGRWAQVQVTDTTNRSLYHQSTTGWAVGDRLAVCGRLTYTYVGGNGLGAGTRAIGPNISYSALNEIPASIAGGYFYREFVVPAGTTRLDTSFGCTNGTAKFAQVGLYNLTALGVLSG